MLPKVLIRIVVIVKYKREVVENGFFEIYEEG